MTRRPDASKGVLECSWSLPNSSFPVQKQLLIQRLKKRWSWLAFRLALIDRNLLLSEASYLQSDQTYGSDLSSFPWKLTQPDFLVKFQLLKDKHNYDWHCSFTHWGECLQIEDELSPVNSLCLPIIISTINSFARESKTFGFARHKGVHWCVILKIFATSLGLDNCIYGRWQISSRTPRLLTRQTRLRRSSTLIVPWCLLLLVCNFPTVSLRRARLVAQPLANNIQQVTCDQSFHTHMIASCRRYWDAACSCRKLNTALK